MGHSAKNVGLQLPQPTKVTVNPQNRKFPKTDYVAAGGGESNRDKRESGSF
jgi:hypothetical protein